MSYRPRFLACLASLTVFSALSLADVSYKVTPNTEKQTVTVEMAFKRTKFDTDLQMPNWPPGGYFFAEFWHGVKSFHAYDEGGVELPFTKPNDYTWRISTASAPEIHVKYEVGNASIDGRASEPSEKALHYSGPSTYMYLVDRKDEPCNLDIDIPTGWQLAIGLIPTKKSPHQFRARTYDVLADNPVTMGKFLEAHYTTNGKDMTIAARGANTDDIDLPRLEKVCKFVSEMQADFFGGSPYDRYVWHFSTFDRPDGAGGLEHLSSTEIGMSPSVGPRVVMVISHEHFHLWNVKRIRSSVLGPFDYTKLPTTGALWWLEGVTDYYSHFLLHRYGWWTDQDLYADIAKNVTTVRDNPKRMDISPYDASFRVREANNGKGNSQGLYISYYDTGWLLGMLLDIEIRAQTGGKSSLDDVEMALWKECRNDQPGFPEDEIRRQCVRFGGPALGEAYDTWVMKPGELPVEAELAKIGLKLVEEKHNDPSLGFTWSSGRSYGGASVVAVTDKASPLKPKDVITEIDGKVLGNRTALQIEQIVKAVVKNSKEGEPVHVKVTRADAGGPKNLELDLNHSTVENTVKVVTESSDATPEQIKLREGWFWGKRSRPTVIAGP